MNERIKELYRQANEQAHQQACEKSKTNRPQNNTVWNEFVPLFAELIVRECARVAIEKQTENDINNIVSKNPAKDFAYALIKHFGVEE